MPSMGVCGVKKIELAPDELAQGCLDWSWSGRLSAKAERRVKKEESECPVGHLDRDRKGSH